MTDSTAGSGRLHCLIIGAGAVGSSLGCWLAEAGVDVAFVARRNTRNTLRVEGIRVHTGPSSARIAAPVIHARPADAGRPDLCILAVKTFALPEVLAETAAAFGRDMPVLALQNGLEVLRQVPAHFPASSFGVVHWNTWPREPGHFSTGRRGPLVLAAEPANQALRDQIAEAFAPALPIVRCDSPRDAALGKLVLNLNNALLTLLDWPRRTPSDFGLFQHWMVGLSAEGLAVVRAAGAREVRLPGVPPWWLIRAGARLPGWMTRGRFRQNLAVVGQTSMGQDLAAGRDHNELEDITGALLRLADETGADAPRNRFIHELARARFSRQPFVPVDIAELEQRYRRRS